LQGGTARKVGGQVVAHNLKAQRVATGNGFRQGNVGVLVGDGGNQMARLGDVAGGDFTFGSGDADNGNLIGAQGNGMSQNISGAEDAKPRGHSIRPFEPFAVLDLDVRRGQEGAGVELVFDGLTAVAFAVQHVGVQTTLCDALT